MLSCSGTDAEPEVQTELHQLERYLHDALGVTVTTTPWRGGERLPPFLKERYRFAQMDLLGMHGLLVVDANLAEQSPAAVRKHIDRSVSAIISSPLSFAMPTIFPGVISGSPQGDRQE